LIIQIKQDSDTPRLGSTMQQKVLTQDEINAQAARTREFLLRMVAYSMVPATLCLMAAFLID
jgi:hypothetical protein